MNFNFFKRPSNASPSSPIPSAPAAQSPPEPANRSSGSAKLGTAPQPDQAENKSTVVSSTVATTISNPSKGSEHGGSYKHGRIVAPNALKQDTVNPYCRFDPNATKPRNRGQERRAREEAERRKVNAQRPFQEFGFTSTTQELVEYILKTSGQSEIITAEEIEDFKTGHRKYKELQDQIATVTPRAISVNFKAQFVKFPELMFASPETQTAMQLRTLADLHNEGLVKRRAIKSAMRRNAADYIPKARAIMQRLQALAKQVADAREADERGMAARLQVKYQPSSLLIALRQSEWLFLRNIPDQGLICDPATLIGFLPLPESKAAQSNAKPKP